MDQLAIRFATPNDSSDIFDWRNDNLSRKMASQSDIVEWQDHQKWFQATLANENTFFLICEDSYFSNEKVGVVRFDFNDSKKEAKISINLSSKMRGKGHAKLCLKSAVEFFLKEEPLCLKIHAEIKAVNISSRKSFEGVGFNKVSEDNDGLLQYTYVVGGASK